jgi:hypothetical protein
MYLQKNIEVNSSAVKTFGAISLSSYFIDSAEVRYTSDRIILSKNIKDFNLLIDLCFDVLLTDPNLQKTFNLSDKLADDNFKTWFENDNVYYLDSLNADATKRAELISLRSEVISRLGGLTNLIQKSIIPFSTNTINELTKLKEINNPALIAEVNNILGSLTTMKGTDIKIKLLKLKTDYDSLLNQTQKNKLDEVSKFIDSYYDNFKELISFYSGLKKSNYEDFTLTQDQYYAMKFIILKFLDLAKNQYPNDVIATVIDFMIENTIVQYTDVSGNSKTEVTATTADRGYLTIDIESLVSAIDQKFSSTSKMGIGVYLQPFFSVGTNYASFLKNNLLTTDQSGASKSLANLYFASEKIGIKWKIYNWKYTHSFSAGQSYNYYGITKYWLRPQPKPAFNDIHILVYGSGLLYNISNLKSDNTFNYAVAGAGLGFTFFNGLSANIGFACPFTDNKFESKNVYFNLGFDIPIIEYIGALAKKN